MTSVRLNVEVVVIPEAGAPVTVIAHNALYVGGRETDFSIKWRNGVDVGGGKELIGYQLIPFFAVSPAIKEVA